MKYNCDICIFFTDKYPHYRDHLDTQKHINNYIEFQNIFKQYNEYFDELMKINNEIDIEICHLNNTVIEHILNAKDKEIEDLKKEHKNEILTERHTADQKIIDTLCKDKDNFSKTNHDMLKILNKLCNSNDKIEPFTEEDCRQNLIMDRDGIDAVLNIYNNNGMPELIVSMIEKKYKKQNPKERKLWGTDPARNNCNIKMDRWQKDPGGYITMSLLIEPILRYLERELLKYQSKVNIEELKGEQLDDFRVKMKYINNISSEIENGKIKLESIKMLTNKFYIDTDNLKNMLEPKTEVKLLQDKEKSK